MPDHDPSHEHLPPLPKGSAPIFAGIIGAPLTWMLALQLLYVLAPQACRHGRFWITALAAVFLAFTIGLGSLCLQYLNRHENQEHSRQQFVALFGLLTSALVALAIVSQTIVTLMLDPCAT
jgi:hypothetical protein